MAATGQIAWMPFGGEDKFLWNVRYAAVQPPICCLRAELGAANLNSSGNDMILIVDDQKDAGTALERLLRYAGHESVSVTGGAEALAMLHVRKPDLMVLDVNMPEMDGLTVLKTIKERDELKDVRIVMYSADPHHETMVAAKKLGALDFLVKGTIAFDKLVARLSELAGEPPKSS
jgi:PleD family two-component response regulator